jgi:mannose-6-phosphate isomerase-like protein (cupin superfamily)
MKESIRRIDPGAEYHTDELCFINELSNTPDDPALSIARARVPPGVVTRWHRLIGTAERYVILEGRGRVDVGALAPEDVGPGDVVIIPPMVPQRIANLGSGDLVFLAICTPRFLPEVYEDIEGEME